MTTLTSVAAREVASLAARYDRARRRERAMKQRAERLQGLLLAELGTLNETQVRADGWQVTRVQSSQPEWDADGLRAELKPSLRDQLYGKTIDLMRLPPETRKRLEGMLTPGERRAATTWTLDGKLVEAMATAGRLAKGLVDRFRSVKNGAPYVRVTRQLGDA